MENEFTVTHIYPQPDDQVRIKLTKNTKGYGWEISVGGKNSDETLAVLRDVEEKIRAEYGTDDP